MLFNMKFTALKLIIGLVLLLGSSFASIEGCKGFCEKSCNTIEINNIIVGSLYSGTWKTDYHIGCDTCQCYMHEMVYAKEYYIRVKYANEFCLWDNYLNIQILNDLPDNNSHFDILGTNALKLGRWSGSNECEICMKNFKDLKTPYGAIYAESCEHDAVIQIMDRSFGLKRCDTLYKQDC